MSGRSPAEYNLCVTGISTGANLSSMFRVSLRYKILAVLGFLLLLAVASYTALASFIFIEEKQTLLFDLNHSLAINASAQLRAGFSRVADSLRLFAVSELMTRRDGGTSPLSLNVAQLKEKSIESMTLYRKQGDRFLPLPMNSGLPRLELTTPDLTRLSEASNTGMSFWRSSEGESKDDRFLLATTLEINNRRVARNESDRNREKYIAVGKLDIGPLLTSIQSANLFESFVVHADGSVLFHFLGNESLKPTPIAGHPVLQDLARSPGSSGVRRYDFQDQDWLGAFSPVGSGDLWFVSQANGKEIRSALQVLVQRSLLFGLIVATLTFIASILFSKQITRNLNVLTARAQEIEAGKWGDAIAIRSGDEVETLAVSFNSMITALKASRDAIEQTNRELEQKVALRTQQLVETNASIKEIQEKLLQTSQLAAVGEVAGMTAHELLNPLTAILSRLEHLQSLMSGGTQVQTQLHEIVRSWKQDFKAGGFSKLSESLLSKSQIHPEQTLLEEDLDNLGTLTNLMEGQSGQATGDLEFVRDQANRIHRIVDGMRQYVRASVKAETRCHHAIDIALTTMRDFLSKHGVEVAKSLQATEDTADLNEDELVQILTNLIRNSFQSIVAAGRKGLIRVTTKSQDGVLAIDVIDNGAGVAPEKIPHLFETGFTTKAPSEGTGLGLSICRRYARAFGGEVELVYSEPGVGTGGNTGRGTCFRVTVPLKSLTATSQV